MDLGRKRANTPAKKRAMMERILKVWEANPTQRLGQLLDNARVNCAQYTVGEPIDMFYVEDEDLVDMVEVNGNGKV